MLPAVAALYCLLRCRALCCGAGVAYAAPLRFTVADTPALRMSAGALRCLCQDSVHCCVPLLPAAGSACAACAALSA